MHTAVWIDGVGDMASVREFRLKSVANMVRARARVRVRVSLTLTLTLTRSLCGAAPR